MTSLNQEDQTLILWRKHLLALIAPLGLKKLFINYHGHDGFREIAWQAEPECTSLGGPCFVDTAAGVQSYATLWDALRAFAWHIVDIFHPDFASDLGGNGTLTFDCAEQTVSLDHTELYVAEDQTITRI